MIAAPAAPSTMAYNSSRGILLPIISSLLFGCNPEHSVAFCPGNTRFISGPKKQIRGTFPNCSGASNQSVVSCAFLNEFKRLGLDRGLHNALDNRTFGHGYRFAGYGSGNTCRVRDLDLSAGDDVTFNMA